MNMLEPDRPGDSALVCLRDADKRYRWGSSWVLRDVNVTVEPGCLVEVRGANGAGKSTLLRMLAGATLPTRGRWLAAPGLAVGYGPERLAPVPPFPAVAYLAHHARMRHLGHVEGERRAVELAQRLGLTTRHLREPLGTLSKGSLQKVVLIQALFGQPALVVLDEPFAGLDVDAAGALDEVLGEATAAGSTVVFSDHREHAARAQADVMWTVSGGAVQQGVADRPVPDLAHLPGVVEAREVAGGDVRLVAASQASDQILAILVANDFHVSAVATDVTTGHVRIEAARRAGEG